MPVPRRHPSLIALIRQVHLWIVQSRHTIYLLHQLPPLTLIRQPVLAVIQLLHRLAPGVHLCTHHLLHQLLPLNIIRQPVLVTQLLHRLASEVHLCITRLRSSIHLLHQLRLLKLIRRPVLAVIQLIHRLARRVIRLLRIQAPAATLLLHHLAVAASLAA